MLAAGERRSQATASGLPAARPPGEPGARRRPERGRQRRALARFVVYLLCAAGLALLVANRSARVTTEAREIVLLKEELQQVESENKRLEMTALQLASLDRVEREARVRLGMTRPAQAFPVPEPLQQPGTAFAAAAPAGVRSADRSGADGVQLGSVARVRLNPEAVAAVKRLVQRLTRVLAGG